MASLTTHIPAHQRRRPRTTPSLCIADPTHIHTSQTTHIVNHKNHGRIGSQTTHIADYPHRRPPIADRPSRRPPTSQTTNSHTTHIADHAHRRQLASLTTNQVSRPHTLHTTHIAGHPSRRPPKTQ